MPAPVARFEILPARGLKASLEAAIADIQENELCYATDEETLYVKRNGVLIAAGGSGSVSYGGSAPGDPGEGDLWYDTESARLFVYTGTEWADASPDAANATVTTSDNPPANPEDGDLWFDTSDGSGRLYVYYVDADSSQWIDASPDSAGGVEEAPIDGNQYARKDGGWEQVVGGGEGGTVINYNGASAWGSVAVDGTINDSLNVASVTKTATGRYSIVFTTPMPSANYVVNATITSSGNRSILINSKTTTGCQVITWDTNAGVEQDQGFDFAVHSSNAIAPQSGVGADAWGNVNANGSLAGGFNVTSANPSTGIYTIQFATPMPNSNYAVNVNGIADSPNVFSTGNLSTTGFTVFVSSGPGTRENKEFAFAVHASSTVTPTYTWTRNGTTLEPANAGDSVDIGSGKVELEPSAEINLHEGNFGNDPDSNRVRFTRDQAYMSDTVPYGTIVGQVNDGGTLTDACAIKMQRDDGAGYSTGGCFRFETNLGTNGNREKVRIRENGDVQIGGTLPASPNISLNADGSASFGNYVDIKSVLYLDNNTSSSMAGMTTAGSKTVFVGTNSWANGQKIVPGSPNWVAVSDERAKQNLVPLTDGLNKVSQLRACLGSYKRNPDYTLPFLIAQDLEKVLPEAVDTTNPDELGIRHTEVIPLLVSALHDTKARIEALEAENGTLSARLDALEGGAS